MGACAPDIIRFGIFAVESPRQEQKSQSRKSRAVSPTLSKTGKGWGSLMREEGEKIKGGPARLQEQSKPMTYFQTKYDACYQEARKLLENGQSLEVIYQYIDSLHEEDYRDHTLMKMARLFASQGRLSDGLRFCSLIDDEIERADAFLDVGRELMKGNNIGSVKDVFKQAIEAAREIKPGAWEMPAIFLQVSDELWNIGEQQEALDLVRQAVEEIKKYTPQNFEASKTLAGCVRVLTRWGHKSQALEVAKNIASPEQRKIVLAEIEKK
jgi:tetratricopeptide (TPR) repeat protein